MSQDNLKAFMVDRLLDLDPSLSTSEGASIYTKVIDPLVGRLGTDPMSVDVETFIISRMRDEFPDFDVHSPGSVLRDMLIKPLTLILEPLRREISFLKTQSSLAKKSALSDDELDALLSNIFSYRAEGDFSYGFVRVYFTSRRSVGIDKSVRFISSNGAAFVAEDTTVYSPGDMERAGNLFYLDLPVRSTTPSVKANVKKGEINIVEGLSGVAKVTNLSSTSGGASRETSSALLSRASLSLSERSLNTERGIQTKIFSNFSGITSVDVVGYGETDMQRDILQASANFSGEEIVGKVLLATSKFYTHPVATPSGQSDVFVPFTNTLALKDLTAEQKVTLSEAKFLRIVDGNGYYNQTLVSRVREIESILDKPATNTTYVKTKDFTVYPERGSIDETISMSGVATSDAYAGLNRFGAQGVDHYLYGDNNGTDSLRGAPMSITENISLSFDITKIPSSVLLGQDYLYVHTGQMTTVGDFKLPSRSRTYPIRQYYTALNSVRVARTDGHLTEKAKVIYPGKTSFSFPEDDAASVGSSGLSIVAFGGPKVAADTPAGELYDGHTVPEYSSSPGASLFVKDAGSHELRPFTWFGQQGGALDSNDYYTETATYEHKEALIKLHTNTQSWSSRSVKPGDFLSLALYKDSFTGPVDDHQINLVWQGVGKVKNISNHDPRILRVEGLDAIPLFRGKNSYSETKESDKTSSSYGWLKFEEDADWAAYAGSDINVKQQFGVGYWEGVRTAVNNSTTVSITAQADAAATASAYVSAFGGQGALFDFKCFLGTDPAHERWLDALGLPKLANYVYIRAKHSHWPGAAFNEGGNVSAAYAGRMELLDTSGGGLAGVREYVKISCWSVAKSWSIGGNPSALPVAVRPGLGGGYDGFLGDIRQIGFNDAPVPYKAPGDGVAWSSAAVGSENDQCDRTTNPPAEAFNEADTKTAVTGSYEFPLSAKGDALAVLPHWVFAIDGGGNWVFDSPSAKSTLTDPLGNSAVIKLKDANGALVRTLWFSGIGSTSLDGNGDTVADTSNPYFRSAHSFDGNGDVSSFANFDERTGKITYNNIDGLSWATAEVSYFKTCGSYRLFWTVYKGSTEVVTPNGHVSLSYSDLTFPPAHRLDNDDKYEIITPAFSTHWGDSYSVSGGSGASAYTKSNGVENGVDGQQTNGLWLRLGKSFLAHSNSVGARPVETCLSAELTGVGGDATNTDWISEIQKTYPGFRYSKTMTQGVGVGQDIDGDPGTVNEYLFSANLLPTTNSSTQLSGADSDEAVADLSLNKVNPLGVDGYLIPHPMGAVWEDAGLTGNLDGTSVDTGNMLADQVVEFYDAASEEISDFTLSVSKIPGSVPFEGIVTGLNINVENDKVHIGGMTDVYLRASSIETNSSPLITMTPETTDADEIIFSGSDGMINTLNGDPAANNTTFFSPTLLNELFAKFGGDNNFATSVPLGGLSLEIINPPSSDIKPTFFRILNTAPGGVTIDGAFEPNNVSYQGLKFRVVSTCTTSLDSPITPLQQGTNLHTVKNSFNVFCATGFDLGALSDSAAPLIDIDDGSQVKTYSVKSVFPNQLTLDKVVDFTKQNVKYSVYLAQKGGVDLPLVRIKRVSLSGENGSVDVPYKDPIDIKSSSFTGLNDDPVNAGDLNSSGQGSGILVNRTVAYLENADATLAPNGVLSHLEDSDVVACLELPEAGANGVDTESFVDWGVITYDVVRFDDLEAPNRHFYALGTTKTSGSGDRQNVLILDRPAEIGNQLDLANYTIGHPSVGSATFYFKDPTYLEVGPKTVISYKDETTGEEVYFRPSPAEQAELYSSEDTWTEATIGANGGSIVTPVQLLKHGVTARDSIQILTKVLYTGDFSETLNAHENLLLSGKVLTLEVGGDKKAVVFSGSNPVSLSSAAADINLQLDGLVSAVVEDGTAANTSRIAFYSSKRIRFINEGTIGIFNDLKIGATAPEKDNTVPNDAQQDFTDVFQILNVAYDSAESAKTTTLNIDPNGPNGLPTNPNAKVFFKVLRKRSQNVFPSGLQKGVEGFYSTAMKLTSFDPWVSTTVEAGQQLNISGHTSLGYDVVVSNNNYSFSVGEKSSLRTTSVIVGGSGESFDKVFVLPGAEVIVEYERSQSVQDVQMFMLLPPERVVNNNPLVRHYFPAYPVMNISCSGATTTAEIVSALQEYFISLYPNLPVEVYDILTRLSEININQVTLPLEMSFLVHDENRKMRLISSKDVVALNKRFHIMDDMSRVIINKV